MKKIISFIMASSLIALFTLDAFAELIPFSLNLDTVKDEYNVGEAVYIKASLTEIKINNGFIGIGICIEFDPEILKAVPGDNGETAEVFLPEEWINGGERIENIVKNEDGTQKGKVLLNYIAPINDTGTATYPLKSDDFYAVVKFECIKEGVTSVRIDGENEYNCCTGYDDEGNVVSYKGKGSEIALTVKSETESKNESKDTAYPYQINSTVYYIIAGAAVVIAAVILIITKKRKKK